MKTITITNQKGGVAKTTTTWHLGVGLNKKGHKVLLIDLDPQSNLSFTAGVDLLNIKYTLYEVFKGEATAKEAIIHLSEGLDILVGGLDLSAADRTFTQLAREKMLSKALKNLEADYDYCVIDTPPSLSVMNENALTYTDYVIIPIQADIYALQGIKQLRGFIEDIKENTNPKLQVLGILITRVASQTNLHNLLYPEFERAAATLNTTIFNSYIRSTVTVGEAALERTNLFDYQASATAAQDYANFVDELISKL